MVRRDPAAATTVCGKNHTLHSGFDHISPVKGCWDSRCGNHGCADLFCRLARHGKVLKQLNFVVGPCCHMRQNIFSTRRGTGHQEATQFRGMQCCLKSDICILKITRMYVTENARANDLLLYIYIYIHMDLNLDYTWFSNCRHRQVLL